MATESYAEQIVRKAAVTYKIPFDVLWGVYGAETGHGSDVKTSSGGAKGSFQFIKPTAETYKYPWTNETSMKVFNEQALAAAHYLSVLHTQTGSWEGAIQGYSGKSYTLAHVLEEAKVSGGGKVTPEGTKGQPNAGESGPSAEEEHGIEEEGLSSPLAGLESLIGDITNPATWLRVAEGIGGLVLFFVGLKTLTRGTTGATVVNQQTGSVKRAAVKVAEVAAVK